MLPLIPETGGTPDVRATCGLYDARASQAKQQRKLSYSNHGFLGE
jgi:hypothetical protein